MNYKRDSMNAVVPLAVKTALFFTLLLVSTTFSNKKYFSDSENVTIQRNIFGVDYYQNGHEVDRVELYRKLRCFSQPGKYLNRSLFLDITTLVMLTTGTVLMTNQVLRDIDNKSINVPIIFLSGGLWICGFGVFKISNLQEIKAVEAYNRLVYRNK